MAIGVTNTQITFRVAERTLTLDFRRVPFNSWAELKKATRFTQSTLIDALSNADTEAAVGLLWLERRQRERKLRYIDVYTDVDQSDSNDELEITRVVVNGRTYYEEPTDDDDVAGDDPASGEEEEDPTGGS